MEGVTQFPGNGPQVPREPQASFPASSPHPLVWYEAHLSDGRGDVAPVAPNAVELS